MLQFDISSQAVLRTDRQRGVDYVSRPVGHFLLPQPVQESVAERLSKKEAPKPAITEKRTLPISPRTERPKRKKPKLAKRSQSAFVVKRGPKPAPEQKAVEIVTVVEPATDSVASGDLVEQAALEAETGQPSLPASLTESEQVSAAVGVSSPGRNEVTESKGLQKALPRYDINPLPQYPEMAQRRGQQGTVSLEVLVLSDGRVGDVRLLVSSGYKMLDQAALKAVKRWQFKPATSLGRVVESRVKVPIDFVLP